MEPKNRLAVLRNKAKLTQAGLSSRSGVSVQYVRLLEQEPARMPGLDIAAALARALSVAPCQLFPRLPHTERESRWEYFARAWPELAESLNDVDRLRFQLVIGFVPDNEFRVLTSDLNPTPPKAVELYSHIMTDLKLIAESARLKDLLEGDDIETKREE